MKLKAKMLDDISANKIVETKEKKFMSPTDIAKIEAALAIGGVGELTASKVTVEDTDSLFTSEDKTVENILKEVFTSASNGKTQIATAIAGMGVEASSNDTFTGLAEKIKNIKSEEVICPVSTINRLTKLNIIAPYRKDIVLSNSNSIDDITTSLLEYVIDTGVVRYTCGFDNTDKDSFSVNDNIVFDGTMRCRDKFQKALNETPCGNGLLYESESIKISDYNDLTEIEISEDKSDITLTAIPGAQLIVANNDIDLTGIDYLSSIEWETYTSGEGATKLLVSFDSGLTWKAYKELKWVNVDIENINDIKDKGMTKRTTDRVVQDVWEMVRNHSLTLKFAYLLEQKNVSDVANTDKISIKITMPGCNRIADKSKYDCAYDEVTNTLSYDFKTSGTYTINYVD